MNLTKTFFKNRYLNLIYTLYEKIYKSFKFRLYIDIDTGIKNLDILSDGITYENIKTLKNNLKKIKI
jgi:transposase